MERLLGLLGAEAVPQKAAEILQLEQQLANVSAPGQGGTAHLPPPGVWGAGGALVWHRRQQPRVQLPAPAPGLVSWDPHSPRSATLRV